MKCLSGVAVGLVLAWNVQAAPLLLGGALTNSGMTCSVADLQGLPSATQTVTINGVATTYTGVPLWALLGNGANVIAAGGNNPILRNYIVASGPGAWSILSLGEVHPRFGGTGPAHLVAYARDGVTLGAPALVVPRDGTGTRNIPELTRLHVSGLPVGAGPDGLSNQFSLSNNGAPLGTIDASVIAGYATLNRTVTFLSAGISQTATFTGVLLWDLLLGSGIGEENLTGRILVARGSDGYAVTFSLAELDPDFGGPYALIAFGDSRVADGSLGTAGRFRIVVPGDDRGGRFVSNLVALEVQAVPEPAALATMLVALAMFGVLLGMRRPRSGIRGS